MHFTGHAAGTGSKPTAAKLTLHDAAFVFFCKSLGAKVKFSRSFIAHIKALEEYYMGMESIVQNILYFIGKRASL